MKSNRSTIVLFLLLSGLLISCSNRFALRSADLLFQVNKRSDFTDAIITSTGSVRELSFSHVGIAVVEKRQKFVMEASTKGGVQKISLKKFLEKSARDTAGNPLVVVYRLKDKADANVVINNASKYLGLPYDSAFQPNDEAMYCSELVYKSFLDATGKPMFHAKAMSFSDSTGKTSGLWIDYFKRMGKPVPEGEPGTNPNAMSKETIIQEVHRFF